MRSRALLVVPFMILGLLADVGCRKAPTLTNEVVAVPATEVALDPNARVWDNAPEHLAKLILQDLVEPRLMKPSTPDVRVRAVTDGSDIAFRLQWLDPSRNDLPDSGRFVDACAVQLPRKIEREAPDPQMGQAGRTVEITFWRADWQAWVDGRPDSIQSIHPNAAVDHYPFQAQSLEEGSDTQKQMARRYMPSEALGNRRSGRRESPVEDMVAEGPGTLTRAEKTTSKGKGLRTKDGWMVVLSRRVPEGLVPRARTQIAFAVWEGSHGEVGSRKMRTGWIPLLMQGGK